MSAEHPKSNREEEIPPISHLPASGTSPQPNPVIGPPNRPGVIGTIGGYELLRCIGEGGMGIVYIAQAAQGVCPTLVSIKVLKPALSRNPRAVEYFLKEARHMRGLSHTNILGVLENAEQTAGAYLVMPYVAGGSLYDLLRSGGPLGEKLILRIALQIASALQYAHGKGIIHRDVKPTNILLDAQHHVYLTDFGLARSLLNDSLTDVQSHEVEGTPHYQSPLAARGEHEDTRGDVYSFGAVLYEMLTGQPPYAGKDREEVLRKIGEGPPAPILKLSPKASPALARIAEGAMARNLRERYAQISDVGTDLQRVQRGQRPLGPREERSLSQRALTLLRTHPRSILAMTLLVAGFAIGIVLWPKKPELKLLRKIEATGVWRWSNVALADFDGDGRSEFFLEQDDKLIVAASHGQIINEWKIPASSGNYLKFGLRADVNGDGGRETLVTWRQDTNLLLSVINQNFLEIKRFAIEGKLHEVTKNKLPVPDSFWLPWKVADFRHDGNLEVLMYVFTGYEHKPRGLRLYDWESQRLIWNYEVGPALLDFQMLDLNGDGVDDFIFGSDAVSNGNQVANETDDNHSYIFALSHNGQPLWVRELGGEFTQSHALITDLDGDGQKEILAWVHYGWERRNVTGLHNRWEKGEVFRLDHSGRIIGRYSIDHQLMSCVTADLDHNGRREVLVSDRLGNLHRLNADLSLRQIVNVVSNRYDAVDLIIRSVADLDLDGRPEIILSSQQVNFVPGVNPGHADGTLNVRHRHEPSVIVLDSNLRILCRYVLEEKWDGDWLGFSLAVDDLIGDKRQEIIALTDKAIILGFRRNLK